MRTAWIFELAPCSSAALLHARLARLERTEASLTLALASHRLTHKRRKTIVHRLRQIDAAIANGRGCWPGFRGTLMFALTDLEICTIGLCATIVLCTIGLANSIYRDLRPTAFLTDFHS